MTVPAIVVRDLRKSYGRVCALVGASFNVEKGEVFALLGPNGAGKSSALEILEGFRPRDAGTVSVLGVDPGDRHVQRWLRQRMGVVLQELAVESSFSVHQVLDRNAGFYPCPRSVDDVIDLVGLSGKRHARVESLSGGQQRRLDLGLGIIGNPAVLFLDEPTTGLDPSGRQASWELIRDLAKHGATIILTSHYLDEVEALADHVAVMVAGRVVASGTPAALRDREQTVASIRFQMPPGAALFDLPIAASDCGRGTVEIRAADEQPILAALLSWAADRGERLAGLSVTRASLQDVYVRLMREADPVRPEAGL